MAAKLDDAREAGARVVATACTYCQIQFETGPGRPPGEGEALPARLVSQLLVDALGLAPPGR
jgi:heterodisulfide reductase subunit B